MNVADLLSADLDELRREGLLRSRRTVRPLEAGRCEVDGRRVLNFAGNDYLGLSRDPRVIAAAVNALQETGAGASASALVTGWTPWHAALEDRLAKFEGEDAAVLFPSGYAANVGTLAALLGPEDAVFCDRFNHASLVDGCRLSQSKLRVYRHTDLERLERDLSQAAGYRRRAIVTDSVFSMDGDVAPLAELAELARRFDALLIVDEAHATGVFGEHGRGVAQWQGVSYAGMVRIGTLSKAIGSLGGFVAGPRELCNWLWNSARTQMFSTALPPSACAAATAALGIIEAEPQRREQLLANSLALVDGLRKAGLPVAAGCQGPFVPVLLGAPQIALEAAERLLADGFLVAGIRPPTVPQRTSRLRISISAAHCVQDVQRLIAALSAISVAGTLGDHER